MFQINFVTIAHKIQYLISSYYLVFLSDATGTSISEKINKNKAGPNPENHNTFSRVSKQKDYFAWLLPQLAF